MATEQQNKPGQKRRSVILFAVTIVVALGVAVGGMALLVNIMERQQEAKNPFYRVVELDDNTVDPEIWGKNFPLQYDDYLKTVDQVRTLYGGSEAFPRTPSDADPRSIVAQSRLEEDPRLKAMWAGYPFAVDFREDRGHAYMLEDQTYTERQRAGRQPGACLNCHSSSYVAYKELGDGDIIAGFKKLNEMPFAEARGHVTHPVACIDCHEPNTMQLRITRPAFMEGMRVLKESEGVKDYDVNTMATRQEMRSYVCAQCHVEYYFAGPEKTLVFPWHKGLTVDDMYEYYSDVGHNDWTHALTGAGVLKTQHPEFEMWRQGVHARAGVSCSDCHMPYKREGAHKISDHHVRSPLLNINRACQTCHKWPEAELMNRVHTIQTRTYEMRNKAMDAMVALITDISSMSNRVSQAQLTSARELQRKAKFFLDFVEAENSTGFHAPQEAMRILGDSINYSRQGQLALRDAPVQETAAAQAPNRPQ